MVSEIDRMNFIELQEYARELEKRVLHCERKLSCELMDRASRGLECPRCGSSDVKFIGINHDGINLNASYDCRKCGHGWEGY